MSRYSHDLTVNKTADQITEIATRCLIGEGFKQTTSKGELVWKKGNGILVGPQFIAVKSTEGNVRVEAWIKFAVLPFVFAGEMDLNGFAGAIPKKLLHDKVDRLEKKLVE